MITRFVKLTLQTPHIETFKAQFIAVNKQIEAMPGCHSVVLLQDENNPAVFFTHSKWDSEDALNAYRKSDLFIKTWAIVKPFFVERAEAWTLLQQS